MDAVSCGSVHGIEYCALAPDRNGWQIQGMVIRAEQHPLLVRYTVTCGATWRTRAVNVEVEGGMETRTLRLTVDEDQCWWSAETEIAAMRGCVDVDLGITAATNTLPIRRLNLATGETRAVSAAWVCFPDLQIEPLPQHYTRLDTLRYRYESAEDAFTAEIVVDEPGVTMHYAGGWERIAATDDVTD